jgi:membrane-associated phospholipid phosphatase
MRYSKGASEAGKIKQFVEGLVEDPTGTVSSLKFDTKLRLRSMNNSAFAKKVENIFLPSNVVIMALLALFSYVFMFGPGSHPNFITFIQFMLFSSLCLGVMEVIRIKAAGDIEKYNINFLRISLISLIIPLMLMQTIGMPQVFVFSTITFLIMTPVIFVIRSKWKISGHMCTFTAASTIMSLVSSSFAPMFLMIPLISWSRIKLKAHTAKQVFIGTLVGFAVPYTFAFLLPLI